MIETPPPTENVTFLFTDIVGSTEKWEQLGDAFLPVLQAHDAILRDAIARYGGYIIKTEGDSFKVAFSDPLHAVNCAVLAQAALQRFPWPADAGPVSVRMAIHHGKPFCQAGDYFGPPVNRTARILSASHGGQVLVSDDVVSLTEHRVETQLRFGDLGYHQLKDLDAPVRLHHVQHTALEARRHPAPQSMNGTRHNLPTQRRSFVGRGREIEMIAAAFSRGDNRLLNLNGPAGIGKTRLSYQAAAEYHELFPDGIITVSLKNAVDLTGAAIEVATALEIDLKPGQPPLETVREYLADRNLLLILDDMDHVPRGEKLLRDLLTGSSKLRCLATSREPLNMPEATEVAVPQLSIPAEDATPSEILNTESGQLFAERAHEANPEFALTTRRSHSVSRLLSRLTGGNPEQIEKAAGSLRNASHAVGKALQNLSERVASKAETVVNEARQADGSELSHLLQGIGLWSAAPEQLLREELNAQHALETASASNDQAGVAGALRRLGNIAFARRRFDRAVTLLSASHQVYHEIKSPVALQIRLELEAARRAGGSQHAESVGDAMRLALQFAE